ncbi:neurogenic locus notch protein 2-like, partial [Clarias magur]
TQCDQVDSCASSPCSNGGACTSLPNGTFSCTCPLGYEGSRCQDDVDECAREPALCRNGGTCENVKGSYWCNCSAGFTGPKCEKLYVPCSPSPCMNGGTCRQTADTSYWCH